MAHEQAIRDLDARLRALPGLVVAFSGGVDSAALLHAAVRVLGERVLAVTADSPSLPRAELADAQALAAEIGARHEVWTTRELLRDGYVRNAADRCFHCKSELFATIAANLAQRPEAAWPVAFGAIADDQHDHRPGGRAAAERGVLAPLADAGFTKADVRRYCAEHGLRAATKPSFACLASRVPYGTAIDAGLLARLEAAEQVLRALGYEQFRVRHHGDVARVELLPEDFERAVGHDRSAVVEGIKRAGYTYVALDLQGYRSGAMNEVLGREA